MDYWGKRAHSGRNRRNRRHCLKLWQHELPAGSPRLGSEPPGLLMAWAGGHPSSLHPPPQRGQPPGLEVTALGLGALSEVLRGAAPPHTPSSCRGHKGRPLRDRSPFLRFGAVGGALRDRALTENRLSARTCSEVELGLWPWGDGQQRGKAHLPPHPPLPPQRGPRPEPPGRVLQEVEFAPLYG